MGRGSMASRALGMGNNEIPSTFLIRALARDEDCYNCEHCGARMFVRFESGLCPFCRSGRPLSYVYQGAPTPAALPFAPRLRRRARNQRTLLRGWARLLLPPRKQEDPEGARPA
jgi:hypothetical protein